VLCQTSEFDLAKSNLSVQLVETSDPFGDRIAERLENFESGEVCHGGRVSELCAEPMAELGRKGGIYDAPQKRRNSS